ncbi:MAG: tail fiber domain-containing protein, partial [Proteobacteria bacterium]|nr:tail fiber domain-containing protein [Pseudomonadota bacterium]
DSAQPTTTQLQLATASIDMQRADRPNVDSDIRTTLSSGSFGSGGDINFSPNNSTAVTIKKDGKVGIGTTDPVSSFHVTGSEAGEHGNGAAITITNSATGGASWYLRAGATGTRTPAGGISLANDGGYSLSIDSVGNVGIGTTSPHHLLDLGNSLGAKLAVYQNTGGTSFYGFGISGSTLEIHAGSSTGATSEAAMVVKDTGNVGIGTTSPAGKLEVVGTGVALTVRGGSGYSNRHVQFTIEGGVSGSPQLYLYANANSNGAAYVFQGLRTGLASDAPLALNPLGGLVGIGMMTPDQKLDIVAGHGRVASGYSWLTNSDSRFKKNIATLENSLEKVTRLRGVRYDLDTDDDIEPDRGKHIGIIAQELETEYPEFVEEDPDGYKSGAYDKLSAVLIEAVKEQQNQIGELKAEHDALKILVCQDHPEAALYR